MQIVARHGEVDQTLRVNIRDTRATKFRAIIMEVAALLKMSLLRVGKEANQGLVQVEVEVDSTLDNHQELIRTG